MWRGWPVLGAAAAGCFADAPAESDDGDSAGASSVTTDGTSSSAGTSAALTGSSAASTGSGSASGLDSGDTTGADAEGCAFELDPTVLLSNLESFPVLVVLEPDVARRFGCDEATLAFRDTGDVRMRQEIEQWLPDGRAWIWVRIPQIDPSSDRLLLDCAGPGAGSEPAEVWRDVYTAVWHFAGDGVAIADAVGQFAGSHVSGDPPISVSGQIASALDFVPANPAAIDINVDPGELSTTALTVEAWVRPRDVSQSTNRRILTKFDLFELSVANEGLPARFAVFAGAAGMDAASARMGAGLPLDQWTYLVGTYRSEDRVARLFVDGGPAIEGEAASSDPPDGPEDLDMAHRLDGTLDEVRIANVAHTPEWIRAQHLSMTGALLQPSPECAGR